MKNDCNLLINKQKRKEENNTFNKAAFSLLAILSISIHKYFFILKGDEAMFGDAEHYKYLTNEADLNNLGDDSIALTPKTPKRGVSISRLLLLFEITIDLSISINVYKCVCVDVGCIKKRDNK